MKETQEEMFSNVYSRFALPQKGSPKLCAYSVHKALAHFNIKKSRK